MTVRDFLQNYHEGQRYFSNLDFEYPVGLSNKSFVDVVFEDCFLFVDFHGSDLTNAKFIRCNIKDINLSGANLTNAEIHRCSVECAQFLGATISNFRFIENYYYGAILWQDDFKVLLQMEEEAQMRNKKSI